MNTYYHIVNPLSSADVHQSATSTKTGTVSDSQPGAWTVLYVVQGERPYEENL